jgi:uncharacterized protein
MSISIFVAVFFSVLALAHGYVGRRIIGAAALKDWRRWAAWSVMAVMLLLPTITLFLVLNRAQGTMIDDLSFAGYTLLGFFSLLLTGIALRDMLILVAGGVRRLAGRFRLFPFRLPEVDRERRRFIIHASNIGVLGLSAATAGYGFFEARRRAVIEEVTVPLKGLPGAFDGFRIVQFTDLHVGPTLKRDFVERVVGQVLDTRADLIAFTGDLVDGAVSWLKDDVAPLASLAAPHGVYFVTGNHEYYSGAEAWIREADRLGFDVLMNEHRVLKKGGASLVLGGVTDYGAGDFIPAQASDAARAVAGAPGQTVKILLAHQPRSLFAAESVGFDLQLSGHTHGGQFFPWNYLAMMAQPYIKGLHVHGKITVYVSRGTGYWGPPLRLATPPEITLLTLRKV